MRTYIATEAEGVRVRDTAKQTDAPLDLARSREVLDIDPGADWGPSSSTKQRSQLALAMILDECGYQATALNNFVLFSEKVLTWLPDEWEITETEILFFLNEPDRAAGYLRHKLLRREAAV